MLLFFLHHSLAVSWWGDQPMTCLLLTLSILLPHTSLMPSFTRTISLLFALPLVPRPGSSNLSIILLINALSLLCSLQCSLSGLISKTSDTLCLSDIIIPNPFHPGHCQRDTQCFDICCLQQCLFHHTWLVSPLFGIKEVEHSCSSSLIPHLTSHHSQSVSTCLHALLSFFM